MGASGVVLVIALVVAGSATGRPQASTIRVSALLTAAQEVPAPKGDVSSARGTFSATVTRSGTNDVMTWQLTFTGLTGPAGAAHVHLGARGQAGGVVVPLCGPCQSPASGTANVDATVLNALQTGGAYANVHTPTNAPGEIRGQIDVLANVTTTLTARQEIPKPKGRVNRARGTFTATVTRAGSADRIGWRLVFSGLTGRAVAAHIHIGARGNPGPVALALCGPCRSGVRKSAVLSPAVVSALEAGRAYVNVHTARNQAGEIRGQIPAVALQITG
jgi:hypothetical protein